MKKYRFKKNFLGFKKGEIIDVGGDVVNYPLYVNPEMFPDWFEPVEDRIELFLSVDRKSVFKMNGDEIKFKECLLMKQAVNLPQHLKDALINGELFTKGDMRDFENHIIDTILKEQSYIVPTNKWFDKWIKNKTK